MQHAPVTVPKSPKAPKAVEGHKAAFFSAFVGWIFDYYEVALITFLIIPIAAAFGLTAGQSALVFSITLLFLAVGGIFFGTLADKFGRKNILFWTIVIYCIGTLLRAFAWNYESFIFFTIIAAIGIGGEYGVGQTLVSETAPKDKRGWWGGLLYGGIWYGIALAALVGGLVAPVIGWRWTFILSALPIFVAIYVRKSAPESAVWEQKVKSKGNNIEWSKIFSKSFMAPFSKCLVAAILQFYAYYGMATFLPTYLKQQGMSLSGASWWIVFTCVAGLTGNLVASYTNDRWGRRITLCYLGVSAAVGGIALFLTWQYLLSSYWILVPFFILYFGTNAATVFGVLFTEMFPSELRSTGVSAALQIGRGLSFFPPLIAASMATAWGYESVVLAGGLLFLALGAWAWVFKETRGVQLD
jgi:MFS family permease